MYSRIRCWRYIGLAFISGDRFFDMICSWVMNCEAVITTTMTAAMTTTTMSAGLAAESRLDAQLAAGRCRTATSCRTLRELHGQQADAAAARVALRRLSAPGTG